MGLILKGDGRKFPGTADSDPFSCGTFLDVPATEAITWARWPLVLGSMPAVFEVGEVVELNL